MNKKMVKPRPMGRGFFCGRGVGGAGSGFELSLVRLGGKCLGIGRDLPLDFSEMGYNFGENPVGSAAGAIGY